MNVWNRATVIVICAVTTLLGACRHTPRVQEVGGPDGSLALVVTCRRYADCFRMIGLRCPNGYSIFNEHKENPSFLDVEPHHKSFSLVVSCKPSRNE